MAASATQMNISFMTTSILFLVLPNKRLRYSAVPSFFRAGTVHFMELMRGFPVQTLTKIHVSL